MADKSRSRIVSNLTSVINKEHIKPGINSDDIEKSLLSDGILDEPVNKDAEVIDTLNNIIEGENPYQSHDIMGDLVPDNKDKTVEFNPSDYLQTEQSLDMDGLDDDLVNRTKEHERRSAIDKLIKGVNVGDLNMENERMDEEKYNLLCEIDILKSAIDDGESLESIPTVDHESPYSQVLMVAKMLRVKNKRLRYTAFAEEMIMLGVHILEELFDGQRVWFNKYKPDLTGWNRSVQVKLRRLRPSLSRGVTSVVDGLGLGLGMELAAELLPSAFMYSRNRQKAAGDDEADYNAAYNKMRK